jgi:hypothetical protein
MFPTFNNPPSAPVEKWDEPKWNPKIHLNIQPPQGMVLLDEQERTLTRHNEPVCPAPPPRQRSKLAYTDPFQYLSAQGVKDLRKVVDYNMKNCREAAPGDRIPLLIRSMGYRSKFIQDMNSDPETLTLLSKLTGKEVAPCDLQTSWGHTNIGVIGADKAVDQWHVDSVPFVLVILLSDMSDSIGGQLEVVKKAPYTEAFRLIVDTGNRVPEQHLLTVNYPTQGCAIYMQGSRMVHHVTPVIKAKERRISVVNSYQPRDPFYPDDTRLSVFLNEPETCMYEFSRHRALRARDQLNMFLSQKQWISNPITLSKELKEIATELDDAVSVMLGLRDDGVKWFEENKKEGGYVGELPKNQVTDKSKL